MGVPSFYRWLSQRYPKIIIDAVEEYGRDAAGRRVEVDSSKPNPNNIEFDNLYLDMNGIIHPCCHPEDKPAPTTEDEMMEAIMEYMDRIFNIIRPRKVLYMAIDGVAPRAKMNQQRSRRFRAAKEARENAQQEAEIRADLQKRGLPLPPPKPKHWDSNVITPGTPFMSRVAETLRYYTAKRMAENSGWKGVKVIISDASVPGEGEHKIIDFIRKQRNQPGYNADTKHVLYGLDADLIMLGLATHEPHFWILREEVFKPKNRGRGNGHSTEPSCSTCGRPGHHFTQCNDKLAAGATANERLSEGKPYQLLVISVLREYLEKDLRPNQMGHKWNLERALDDWVFICFFVGNDFLPHMPTLKIREGAIGQLMDCYRQLLPSLGGYLTDMGEMDLARVSQFTTAIGKTEDAILRRRRSREQRQRDARRRRKLMEAENRKGPQLEVFKPGEKPPSAPNSSSGGGNLQAAKRLKAALGKRVDVHVEEPKDEAKDAPNDAPKNESKDEATDEPKDAVAESMDLSDSISSEPGSPLVTAVAAKKPMADDEDEVLDEVRLGEDGWKERYYEILL